MWKRLSYIQSNLRISIPAMMLLGILFGYFYQAAFLKALIVPFTFLMVYPMMVNLQISKVFSKGDGKVQLATQIINFLIIPFVAYALGNIFFKNNPMLALGLLLAALLPTSGMTISWTGFAKGNINAAIKMTVIGLVAGSILTPLYANWLMGAAINIPLTDVFTQIIIIIFLPMAAGFLTQKTLVRKFGLAKYNKDIKNKFPMISTIGVLGIVFVAMAVKSKTIISNPSILAGIFIPLIILYAVNFLISTIAGKFMFSRADGIALVYGTVMRNLSIALAIAMTVFKEKGSDIALIIALAYIIQVQSAAWYVKFTGRIFGPAPEDTAKDIKTEGIFALHSDATLHDAIKLLDEEHIHTIAVLNNKEEAAGMISSGLIINLLADGIKPDTLLKDIKLEPVIKIDQNTPLSKILKTMKRKHNYKFLVVNKNKITGVLTESDIIKHYV